MYIIKNAWRNLLRAKGRNILIGLIVCIIALSSCIALIIMDRRRSVRKFTKFEGFDNPALEALLLEAMKVPSAFNMGYLVSFIDRHPYYTLKNREGKGENKIVAKATGRAYHSNCLQKQPKIRRPDLLQRTPESGGRKELTCKSTISQEQTEARKSLNNWRCSKV